MPQKPSNQIIGNKPSAVIVCASCGVVHVFRLELTIQFLTLTCDCGNLVSWSRSDQATIDAGAVCDGR